MSETRVKKVRVKMKESTRNAIEKLISENLDLSQQAIAELLNANNIRTPLYAKLWTQSLVSSFMNKEMNTSRRVKYTKGKNTKVEIINNKDLIDKIILENSQSKTLNEIATILNNLNLRTVKNTLWDKNSIWNYKKWKLNITNDSSILRFQENIMNQLEKVEPKVIPQPEPEIETEIEVIPKYEITELVVKNNNGKFVTDSLKIASIFKRDHKNVLRDIKELNCSEKFSLLNFEQSEYLNDRGRKYPLFILSKDGFTKLVFGWKDDKSAEFQEMYIEQFNKMEQALKNQQEPIQIPRELSTLELMEMTSKTFREQETKILSQIKKETTEALETQKKEIDIKLQELDKKISNIPTASQPTEQLSFIQGNTKLINISEKMQSKAHKEDDLFKATKDLIFKYSVKSKKDEWDIYPLLYKTFKHSTGIYLEKEKNIYNKQFLVAERISTIKYAQLKGHIPELHQIMTNLYNNLILESKEG